MARMLGFLSGTPSGGPKTAEGGRGRCDGRGASLDVAMAMAMGRSAGWALLGLLACGPAVDPTEDDPTSPAPGTGGSSGSPSDATTTSATTTPGEGPEGCVGQGIVGACLLPM